MKLNTKLTLITLAASALSIGSASAATTLAADDFSEVNGTLLHNKSADFGGTWNVTVNNTVTIQGGAFDTDQAPGVQAFLSFSQALGSGETLSFEFTTLNTSGTMFTAGGLFAGFNIYAAGTNHIFVGDPGGGVDTSPQNWSLSGTSTLPTGLAVTQTSIDAEAVSGIFTYNYDTGAASLFVDDGVNTDTINISYVANLALDQIRFASGSGASEFNLDSFEITAIPEPSATLLGGLGMMLLLRRRSR